MIVSGFLFLFFIFILFYTFIVLFKFFVVINQSMVLLDDYILRMSGQGSADLSHMNNSNGASSSNPNKDLGPSSYRLFYRKAIPGCIRIKHIPVLTDAGMSHYIGALVTTNGASEARDLAVGPFSGCPVEYVSPHKMALNVTNSILSVETDNNNKISGI